MDVPDMISLPALNRRLIYLKVMLSQHFGKLAINFVLNEYGQVHFKFNIFKILISSLIQKSLRSFL